MSEAPHIIKRVGLRYVLSRVVVICGQIIWILCSVAWRFNELKAFLASTTASILLSSKMHRILWIAASAPDCNPVAVSRSPAAIPAAISSSRTHPLHLHTILCETSPIPVGLTPRFLSREDQLT